MTDVCSSHSHSRALPFSMRSINGDYIIMYIHYIHSIQLWCGRRPDGRHRSVEDSTVDRGTVTYRRLTDYFHTVRKTALVVTRLSVIHLFLCPGESQVSTARIPLSRFLQPKRRIRHFHASHHTSPKQLLRLLVHVLAHC